MNIKSALIRKMRVLFTQGNMDVMPYLINGLEIDLFYTASKDERLLGVEA